MCLISIVQRSHDLLFKFCRSSSLFQSCCMNTCIVYVNSNQGEGKCYPISFQHTALLHVHLVFIEVFFTMIGCIKYNLLPAFVCNLRLNFRQLKDRQVLFGSYRAGDKVFSMHKNLISLQLKKYSIAHK